jgi:hypothetical protein
MQKLSEMGVMKRLKLKAITKIQKLLLKSQKVLAVNLYYYLARLHFKIYVDGYMTLDDCILNDNEAGNMAARRHARLVINSLYPDASDAFKKWVRAAARGSFRKNIIINAVL